LIADVLNIPIITHEGGEAGGALGAARLAWLVTGGDEQLVCAKPKERQRYLPDSSQQAFLQQRLQEFRLQYRQQVEARECCVLNRALLYSRIRRYPVAQCCRIPRLSV
jgi:xylulokinase